MRDMTEKTAALAGALTIAHEIALLATRDHRFYGMTRRKWKRERRRTLRGRTVVVDNPRHRPMGWRKFVEVGGLFS